MEDVKFANVFLEIEAKVYKEIVYKLSNIGVLLEGHFSIHELFIDFIDKEACVTGFDKVKGKRFTLVYGYDDNEGYIHYTGDPDDEIIEFSA